MIRYNKLVRDKIPAILNEKNKIYIMHQADNTEYENKLKEKLMEEVKEFLESPSLEELADIQEVVLALLDTHKWSYGELEKVRQTKLNERGGFTQHFILEAAE
jgi:predicted house-cleaning noncanonical NTP pyrophosphatase (MazG superfamily)